MAPRDAVWAITGAAETGVAAAAGVAAGRWPQAATSSVPASAPPTSRGRTNDRRGMIQEPPLRVVLTCAAPATSRSLSGGTDGNSEVHGLANPASSSDM